MKRMARRDVLTMMVAVGMGSLGAAALSACGATATPASAPATSAPTTAAEAANPTTVATAVAVEATPPQGSTEKFTLDVLFNWPADFKTWFDETQQPVLKESWPGITLNYVQLNWDTQEEQLLTGVAAGMVPDVVHFGAGQSILASKVALPLDDRIDDWGAKDDFVPVALESELWDGHTWIIPEITGIYEYCYRKDIADQEGVTIPNDWTYDDLMDAAVGLTKFEGDKIVRKGSSTTSEPWKEFISMLVAAGGRVTEGGKTAFNSEEGVWALTFYVDRNNAVEPQNYAPLEQTDIPYFAMGLEVIEYGHAGSYARQCIKYAPETEQYVTVPLPPTKQKSIGLVFADGQGLGKTSKHPDAAWDLVKLVASTEGLSKYLEFYGILAARKSANDSSEYIKSKPYMQSVVDHYTNNGVVKPQFPEQNKSITILHTEMEAAVLKQKTPEDALAAAAAEWDKILQDNDWTD